MVPMKIGGHLSALFPVNGKNGGKIFGVALMLFGLVIIAIAFTQR